MLKSTRFASPRVRVNGNWTDVASKEGAPTFPWQRSASTETGLRPPDKAL